MTRKTPHLFVKKTLKVNVILLRFFAQFCDRGFKNSAANCHEGNFISAKWLKSY